MPTMTVRHKILDFLVRRQTATAAQIGRAFSMSTAAVRHHLSILAADGRIVAEGTASRGRRGRPEKIYRLSDKQAGENLGILADLALSAWLGSLQGARRGAAVQALAERLANVIGMVDSNLPAPKRVVQLIDKLNQSHYRAHWEAGAEGPRIVLGQCPYAAIIAAHPELCAMDASLLRLEIGAEAEQLSKIGRGPSGATECVFAVRRQPAKAGD